MRTAGRACGSPATEVLAGDNMVADSRSGGLAAVVTDIQTARLILHPVDVVEARRIRDRNPSTQDLWAVDYPFDGDLRALGAFVAATERYGEQRPFGYYQVIRRADGQAIGGVGFKGPPGDDGAVEVGYGLASSARGHGYATEALAALLAAAARLGATTVRADTARDNEASRRTLERAGFRRVAADADLLYYELQVTQSGAALSPSATCSSSERRSPAT